MNTRSFLALSMALAWVVGAGGLSAQGSAPGLGAVSWEGERSWQGEPSEQARGWAPPTLPWQDGGVVTGLGMAASPQLVPADGRGAFLDRALLAAGGGFAGALAGGYAAWSLKGGSSGCDLCWEAAAGVLVGCVIGGAWATTLADGTMGRALVGSTMGTAVGLIVVGVLDLTTDLDPSVVTFSFALPYSLITSHFAGG